AASLLTNWDQQPGGSCPQALGQRSGPPAVEIELYPELSESGVFGSGRRVAHPMNEAARRIPEMHDAGLDEDRITRSRRPGYPQRELECRIAAALGLRIGGRRADGGERLDGGGREAVDQRHERKPPTRIQIRRLDPIAYCRN